MGVKITDTDMGMKALLSRTGSISGALGVSVGITANAGREPKEGTPGATLLQVASAHEFGTRTIPKRSFIRDTFDARKARYIALMRAQAGQIIDGKLTQRVALAQLGAIAAGDIQKRISAGIGPALDPETVRRKGSNKPLIDTGQLRQSITYEVGDD